MRITLLVALVAVIGCDRPQGRPTHPPETGGDLDGGIIEKDADNGTWDGFIHDMASLPGDAGEQGCPPEATWIYTIDDHGVLSSFKPNAKDISKSIMTDVGTLTCMTKTFKGHPFSMSVDRMGMAWVEYFSIVSYDGSPTTEIFKVSTTDASCTATTFTAPQAGISSFGMGFSTDGPTSTTDTLFISGADTKTSTLGTLTTTDLKIATIGQLTGNAELSGSGKGALYGFYPDESNPRIVTIDKKTAAESNVIKLAELKGKPSAWAFGFWGGDFWIFLQRDGETGSTLYHVRGTDGKVNSWKLPRENPIVGAGVSTCAPPAPIP